MKNTVYKSVYSLNHYGKNYASNALVHVGAGLDSKSSRQIINQCYDITQTLLPPPCRRPSTHRPSLYFASVRWFRDARIYCIPVRTIPSRPRDVPQPHANSKDLRCWKLQFKEQEERARLLSIQTKREQWKAASARYYEKHPEVKERKRVIMAEKRAAKKLARRRVTLQSNQSQRQRRAEHSFSGSLGIGAIFREVPSAVQFIHNNLTLTVISGSLGKTLGVFSGKEGNSDGQR
ncbi:hypothetical protein B0H13DRAFT_1910372 [Mycena leptocephala]|nr:hypothetical protein B0H13DRAFT_1910372 [Mycena leptocephala]